MGDNKVIFHLILFHSFFSLLSIFHRPSVDVLDEVECKVATYDVQCIVRLPVIRGDKSSPYYGCWQNIHGFRRTDRDEEISQAHPSVFHTVVLCFDRFLLTIE